MTLKARIRAWLGIDDLILGMKDVPSVVMLQVAEANAKKRHEELMGAIRQLTVTLQNNHAFERPQFAPDVLSWETVEAISLHQLMTEPAPKEQ